MLGDVVTKHHNTGYDSLYRVLPSELLHLIGGYGLNGDPLPEILISNSALLLYRGLSYCEKRMPAQKLSLGPNTLEQVPAEQHLDSRSQINSTSLEACSQSVCNYWGQFPTETQALFWEWDILLLLHLGPDVF
ncbi:hypothetical protein ARMGADRAFT_1021856 [Armillaria gallica]|uniref:Uncharacterized protein n=1 Tax=Armillaria gallica TaxID=47427 RepID=A0A2H3E6N3_ARMGA|nr:hypothetical protein ARMGADRAFT_1021856 [Armillaria gallica]